jgi:hypothetical protein
LKNNGNKSALCSYISEEKIEQTNVKGKVIPVQVVEALKVARG